MCIVKKNPKQYKTKFYCIVKAFTRIKYSDLMFFFLIANIQLNRERNYIVSSHSNTEFNLRSGICKQISIRLGYEAIRILRKLDTSGDYQCDELMQGSVGMCFSCYSHHNRLITHMSLVPITIA